MRSLDLTKTGGMDFAQDDIAWMQAAVIEAISGLSAINGIDTYVVKGCTGFFTSFAAGVLVINGEVCVFDGETITVGAGENLYWLIDETFDPAGLIPFFVGGPKDMYKVRKAILVSSATAPAGGFLYDDMPRQEKLLAQAISTQPINFTKTIGFANGGVPAFSSGVVGLGVLGNTFTVAIGSNDSLTSLTAPAGYFPNGTPVFIYFSGAAGNKVTITQSSTLLTAFGDDYLFYAGEWAMFMSSGGGVFSLVTKSRGAAYTPIWDGAISGSGIDQKIIKGTNQLVTFCGGFSLSSPLSALTAQTLFAPIPARYRPLGPRAFSINDLVTGQPGYISISGTGDVKVTYITSCATPQFSLDGVNYYAGE